MGAVSEMEKLDFTTWLASLIALLRQSELGVVYFLSILIKPPSRSYSLRRLARLNFWLASRLAATFMAG